MIMAPLDLSELLEEYEDKWIVLSKDNKRVIASGNSPDDIRAYAQQGIVMRVPRFDVMYSPQNVF